MRYFKLLTEKITYNRDDNEIFSSLKISSVNSDSLHKELDLISFSFILNNLGSRINRNCNSDFVLSINHDRNELASWFGSDYFIRYYIYKEITEKEFISFKVITELYDEELKNF